MLIDFTHLTTGEAATRHDRRRLDRCLVEAFDPVRISRWLEASVVEAGQEAILRPADFVAGGFLLPFEQQAHEHVPGASWRVNVAGHQATLSAEKAAVVLQALAYGVRGAADDLFGLLLGDSSPKSRVLAERLRRTVLLKRRDLRPGVYRWIHATLLVVSATTVVVLDPIAFSHLLPEDAPVLALDADGILITHTHRDHWHPAGIAPFLGDETALVVPRVPRPSILSRACPADDLRDLRVPHLVLDWGETAVIGDIEVDALPFFGEQPLVRGEPRGFPIRNWGNCYRVTTPDFSILVLVDSGEDPAGTMVDVLDDDRHGRGPADLVLACMREFLTPFFGGLPSEWLALRQSELQRLFSDHQSGATWTSTAGISGLARACKSAGVRHFAPYAHGYEGMSQTIGDIGWGDGEPSEEDSCRALFEAARSIGHDLRPISWDIGDGLELHGGGWRRRPGTLLSTHDEHARP